MSNFPHRIFFTRYLTAIAFLLMSGFNLMIAPVQVFAVDADAKTKTTKSATDQSWIERSNEHSQVLIKVMSKFNPEMAGRMGVEGLDEEIMDLNPRIHERSREAIEKAVTELQRRLQSEKHPAIRQDLEINIGAGKQSIEGDDLMRDYQISYINITQQIFYGIHSLLDEQVAASRHPSALVRLRRYAGMEKGYTPLATLAKDRTLERLNVPNLVGPPKREVEKDLANAPRFIAGIEKLFQTHKVSGYEEVFENLKTQLTEYNEFVRAEILPRARTDFRQPHALYEFSLKQFGIDMPIKELSSRARIAYKEIQEQMQAMAPLVAKEKGYKVTDYRDVIRELKKKQLYGDAILTHYKQRIKDLEQIIRREKIVTLPDRECKMRLATEAESAAVPAPHMQPPRMLNNNGELGSFVLPLRIPSENPDEEDVAFDDFTFEAGSWTLTAHEARPGHELQFASIIENGISIARALFAMNSVNAEGWGLYSEWEVKPYLPLDGQLISLQHRLLRAARAFLDPGIQNGTISPESAKSLLMDNVVISDAMATQEIERYMFWAPGQATSYFCGYLRLLELRAETELALGDTFDRMAFNDFILSQGLLPPILIRKAVQNEFIPQFLKTKNPSQSIAG